MIGKSKLIYNTVKHLRPTQVFYQFKYRLIKAGTLASYDKAASMGRIEKLEFECDVPVFPSYLGKDRFVFLNLEVQFDDNIDWAYMEHGKLWNYNLQYANWLLQEDMPLETKKDYLKSIYKWLKDGRLALEPYPASLRVMNVVRLHSMGHLLDEDILRNANAELIFLSKRLEYHLLGNHLLENAFALIMGGAFFGNKKWISQGQGILQKELKEQILNDGAHFELSAMYHQIMLFRLLELIDWYSKWRYKDSDFESFLRAKAGDMLAWLNNISFADGSIPHFNDSAEGIAFSTSWLMKYADKLGIKNSALSLGTSGYRSVAKGGYECKVDFAQVGAAYQAGHGHADALSFVMYYNGKPLFVEKGTSTYQNDRKRYEERATSAHNTVVVGDSNQSVVWSAFRVAQRAVTTINDDMEDDISASHDGYKRFGIIHRRRFVFSDDQIVIDDVATGNDDVKKIFYLHIDPERDVMMDENHSVMIDGVVDVDFIGASAIGIENYEMADGYNKYREGKRIVVTFVDRLRTKIVLK